MQKYEVASRRYGHALFDVAKANDKIDLFLDELRNVSNILINNDELKLFLEHPSITNDEKKRVLQNIFKGKVDDEIIKLMFLLIDHDRINEIRTVYYDYKYLVYKEKGIKIAYVTTAVKMNDEEMSLLKTRLREKYSCDIEVQNIVDPEVIGGVFLKIGDRIIDGTIRGNLENMRKSLLDQYKGVKV
ncbi:F0F1 ATP synthase subunit delta [Fonticella tunisiensis]|uniref:ATP synthase subunit delta n=1 Tax=Fonticella tunisiensis TaxID=1096341 RepID=A0A4R7KT47_9CLOT|nr:F0F1 ATP synthase subunit delta [Fonticella tunisiensis]TDT62391.1 ATP synthase F1 subcomplex delta subunit [Fonticella tunisiensis]